MRFYEEPAEHGEATQEIIQALCDQKICLGLTRAACILMAANSDLSPHDAALDACQVYCYLLELKSQRVNRVN